MTMKGSSMITNVTSRRDFLRLATAGAVAATVVAASAGEALAYQSNMERALGRSTTRSPRYAKLLLTKAGIEPPPFSLSSRRSAK
jgi:hypothetical protein